MRRLVPVLSLAGGALLALAGLFAVKADDPQGKSANVQVAQASRSESATKLPVARVVLFNSGVGYFQREGDVEGDTHIDLAFPVQDVNDLLKSLVVQDLGGGQVSAVSLDSQAPVEKTLKSFAIDLSGNPSLAQIMDQARGEKVEVVLQQTATSQPGSLTGSIVGVERQKQTVNKDAVVEVEQLNLWCAEGLRQVKLADLQRVRFLNPILDSEFRKALEVVTLGHDTQKKSVSFNFSGQGKRSVRVGYVVENPIWKTSYRLVLNKEGKPYLQGWAVVENQTDEDWQGVRMALVSGRPVSFRMDLYQPLFVPRPTVEPELFASLRPPSYSGAMSRTRDSQSPPPGEDSHQPSAGNGPTVKVLVARRSIPYGTLLNEPEKFFRERVFARGQQPSSAIASYEELRGKFLSRPLVAEQFVTRDDLLEKESMGMVGRLPPQKRGVAVPVNAQALAGGFVAPNNRVDVICTIRGEEPKIILQDIPILAIDTNEARGDGQQVLLGGTATLQVDPDQAELLAYVKSVGQISLVPRVNNDRSVVKTPGKSKAEVLRVLGRNGEGLDLARGVQNVATAQNLGDAFEYAIDQPVSLARQKSALLPVVNQPVEAARVSIYNEIVHPKYPLLGLRFKNAGTNLSQGPLTVFDGQGYAGDAQLPDLQPKEERLLSYAIDLGTEVQVVPHAENGVLTTVKLQKGIVVTASRLKESKTYTVTNRSEQDRVLLIEHPFRPEFKLTSVEKPAETARDVYRFELKAPRGKTVKQTIAEERTLEESVALTNFNDDSLRLLIGASASTPKVKEALQVAVEKRGRLARTQREIAEVQRELETIKQDQPRLRNNLEKVPGTDPLAKRILEKLNKQETDIERYDDQLKQLNAQADRQRKEFEDWLAALNVE